MLRQYISMTIGAICLLAAVAVGAEAQTAPPAPEPGNIDRHIEQGKAYIDRLHKMVSDGFSELEEARKSQNISRVNCVNEALTTMKGLMRLAEGNYLGMQECGSRKDAACAEHEYVKISIAFNKAEELDGQLKGCGGPAVDGAIDGKPYIEKKLDSDLPDIDPTQGLTDIAPMLETPPSASPFFCEGAACKT
jgi:hypothetical protein